MIKMNAVVRWIAFSIAITYLPFPVLAQALLDKDVPDLDYRMGKIDIRYTINADGSFIENRAWEMTVLKESALEESKTQRISYSTSIETSDVIEAYTRKPDGKRIDAPKDNFQIEANSGRGKDSPIFSDRTYLSIVFPDVSVGDTLVLTYKLTAKEPMFHNQFSTVETFSRNQAYDNVHIQIDSPETLWTQYKATDLKESSNEIKNGRKIVTWQWSNPHPKKSKRQNYSVYNRETEPSLAFSTFHNYEEIAKAYGEKAIAKAAVTDKIREKANSIAGDSKDPREITRKLYEWVATNVHYAGNCVGLGAVVPHDTDFILENRIGDCKDHATLLQALLQAKGIEATQALINAGSSYQLDTIPVVSMVNHVINYIPSMDLFLDSTSDSTPLGMLPDGDQGKPVLLVQNYREGSRTPTVKPGTNTQKIHTEITIHADGSAHAETRIDLTGELAANYRRYFRNASKDYEDDIVKNYLKRIGLEGSGTFTKDDPKALVDTYHYSANMDISNLVFLPSTGGFRVEPLMFNPMPLSAWSSAAFADLSELTELACSNVTTEETYVYHLPDGMKIIATPDDSNISNDRVSFTSTHKLDGNTLTVFQKLDDRTPGAVCPVAMAEEDKAFAKKTLPILKSQIIFKM